MTLIYVGAVPPASAGPTEGILRWKSFVMDRWPGGANLGTWVVRPIRGGTSLSVHAVGRAWDWRYADPGPGRAVAEEAMAFTIEHHELLGIQAIHDYVAGRIWRSSRPGSGPAWRDQPPSNEMGQSWATWLHWEVHPESPLHRASVVDVITAAGVDPGRPDRPDEASDLPMPTLRAGDRGSRVVHLQHVLAFWGYYRARIDGDFGPRTKTAVAAWQVALRPFRAGPADGVYGPRTHAAARASYAALRRMRVA